MKLDITIRSIIQEIQEELKEKKGIELSEQEIFNMVDVQFKVLHFGISKGLNVRLPILGTWKRKQVDDIRKSAYEIYNIKEVLNENEYSDMILEAKIRRLKNKKTIIKKSKRVSTLEELKEMKDFKFRKVTFNRVIGNE